MLLISRNEEPRAAVASSASGHICRSVGVGLLLDYDDRPENGTRAHGSQQHA